MMSFITELGPWNWLFAAAALFILEAIVPGVFLLWFGFAAVVVGVIALSTGMALSWQLFTFGIFAILSVLAARRLLNYGGESTNQNNLNIRGQQYVGRSFVLENAIKNGRGRVRVGDSLWVVEGPDIEAGATVRVTDSRGTLLVVEPLVENGDLSETGKLS